MPDVYNLWPRLRETDSQRERERELRTDFITHGLRERGQRD